LIRDYFARNHAYRTGTQPRPPRRAFVVWTTMDVLRSTRSGARPRLVYGDAVDVFGGCNMEGAGLKLRQFLADDVGYELGIINCRTFATVHQMFEPNTLKKRPGDIRGQQQLPEREEDVVGDFANHPDFIPSRRVAQAKPKTLFYHMLTSEPGRHDSPNYLCGAYMFAGSALVMIAGTQHGGVVGTPNIYPDLAAGKTFGEAWRNGLNYGETQPGEPFVSYYCWLKNEGPGKWTLDQSMDPKAVLHGDGTLRLSGDVGKVRHGRTLGLSLVGCGRGSPPPLRVHHPPHDQRGRCGGRLRVPRRL
jgi:hypothetical protein